MNGNTSTPINRITIYLPNQDSDNQEIPEIWRWIDEAGKLFVDIDGGVTIILAKGMWCHTKTKALITEESNIVYANAAHAKLVVNKDRIYDFIRRFGTETFQDIVTVEYQCKMHFLSDYYALDFL